MELSSARMQPSRKSHRLRPLAWAVVVLVPLALAGASVWLLAQRLRGPTEARWTESDLPVTPPDAENGWAVVRDDVPELSFDDATQEHLHQLLDTRLPVSQRLAIFDRAAGTLRIESEEHTVVLEAALRALARPRFADGCPFPLEASCPALELLTFQYVIARHGFGFAGEDRLPEALAIATQALRAHLDLAATARGITTMMIAAITLTRSLALLEDLVALVDRSGLASDVWSASSREMRELLEARAPLDGTQAVRGEYVGARRALAELVEAARGRTSSFGLDERATSVAIDDHYSALHAYAEDPSQPRPVVRAIGEATPWWIHNPIGDLMLDVVLAQSGRRFDQLREADAEIEAQGEALRRALPTD